MLITDSQAAQPLPGYPYGKQAEYPQGVHPQPTSIVGHYNGIRAGFSKMIISNRWDPQVPHILGSSQPGRTP